MSDDPFPTDLPAPSGQVVDHDTPCIKCGYNLRTVPVLGRCPECGAEVGPSLRGDSLAGADPEWLGKIHLAVTLMLIQVVISFSMGLCAGVLQSPALQLVISLVAAVLSLAAAWLLTTPEPRAWQQEQSLTLRQALRICAVINVVATFVQLAGSLSNSELLVIAGSVIALPAIASPWLMFLYFSRLSSRIPDYALSRQFRIVMWGFTAALGLIILAALLALVGLGPLVLVLVCPASLGLIVFGIWALILLVRFRNAVGVALQQARMAPPTPGA